MIQEKHKKAVKTAVEPAKEYKKYIPVVGMCLLLVFSMVASTAVITQPVQDTQTGTVSAQSATFDDTPVFGTNDNYNGDIIKFYPNNMSVDASHTFSNNPKDRGLTVTTNGYVYAADADTIVKMDTDLNVITKKTYSTIDIRGISSDVDGGLYLARATSLQKLDSSLNTVWTNTDAKGAASNYNPSVDAKGSNVYVANNSAVIAVDRNGNTLWINNNVSQGTGVVRENGDNVGTVTDNQRLQILDKSTGNVKASVSFGGLNVGPTITASESIDGGFWVGASAGSDGAYLFDSSGNVVSSFGGYNVQSLIPSNDDTEVIHSSQFNSQTLKTSDTGTQVDSLTPYVTLMARSDYTVTPPPPEFNETLQIDVRNYIKHDNTSKYEVHYTNPDTGNTSNVTGSSDLTVNTSNSTVFTLNKTANRAVATSNKSVNSKANLTAEYDGVNTVNNSEPITVANATVDNLEILPGLTRVEATYTDSNIVLILIGTMLGVIATRFSSAFAGIATIQLTLVAGFFVDLISLGVVLVGLFGALFIGLNLAANIDYTVRG